MQFGSLSPSCFTGMKRGKLYAREGLSIENRTIQNECIPYSIIRSPHDIILNIYN